MVPYLVKHPLPRLLWSIHRGQGAGLLNQLVIPKQPNCAAFHQRFQSGQPGLGLTEHELVSAEIAQHQVGCRHILWRGKAQMHKFQCRNNPAWLPLCIHDDPQFAFDGRVRPVSKHGTARLFSAAVTMPEQRLISPNGLFRVNDISCSYSLLRTYVPDRSSVAVHPKDSLSVITVALKTLGSIS